LEDFAHPGGAEGAAALVEGLADLIDRVVLLAQLHDELSGGGLFRLGLGAVARGDKKDRIGLAAEVMTKDVEGVERVTEGARDLRGRLAFDQVGAQGFVLAVFGQAGFEKEAAETDYVFRCAYNHALTFTHTIRGVKR